MINIYEILKSYPPFTRQLNCKGLLFTQYDCPQIEGKMQVFVECSYIAYVLSGRRIFHKNNERWDLSKGVCVFVKKGSVIAEKKLGDDWCVMVFFVPDPFLKRLINESRRSLPMNQLPAAEIENVLPLEVNELSKSFFQSMLPYFSADQPPPENLLELKFKELILSLLANKRNQRFLSYLNNLSQEQTPSIEDVMNNNFTFNLTLVDYAKLTCTSVPTFKRQFKKIFNDSPARWVIKKRMHLAAQLLENTKQTVSEIAYECGFENQAHFSRVFKENFGDTPLHYRIGVNVNSNVKL